MSHTALSAAKSILAPLFLRRFHLKLVPGRCAARQIPARGLLAPLFAMALLFVVLSSFTPLRAQSPQVSKEAKENVLKNYGKIPLHFEANLGQAGEEAKFVSRGNGYAFYLTPSESVLVLRRNQRHLVRDKAARHDATDKPLPTDPNAEESKAPLAVLHSRLLGANPTPSLSAGEALQGKANYFIGNDPKKWRTNVPSYRNVKYEQLYPGVDLIYYGNQSQLEYDFVVAPGASPKRIRLAISGEEISPQAGAARSTPIKLKVAANGDLVVTSTTSEVRYQKPVAYQTAADGHKQLVAARFVLKSRNEVGFAVPSYDPARTLIIDPTLLYSTYIAGATAGPYFFGYFGDQAAGIAVDSAGSAYITGVTASGDFPVTSGADQTVCKPYGNGCTNGGAWQPGYGTAVFVSKLSPDGSSLVYSTYLAGSVTDSGSGIAVDSSGNAYIAGQTNSPDFPVTQGAYQTVCGPRMDAISGYFCDGSQIVSTCGNQGYPDGFVTKLNPTGSALVYSTFVGGSLNDYLTGIAVNSNGEAYVSGVTLSSYSYSPPGGGCGCPNGPGTCDPYATVSASYGYPVTPNGYFPGPLPAPPSGYQIWPFGSPSAFTGPTNSVLAYPFSDNHTPVFSVLSADGSTMVYSTYLGGGLGPVVNPGSSALGDGQTMMGTLTQVATGIAIDSSGNAYLTGYSNASDLCCTQYGGYQYTGFPTTPGVVQPHNATYCANSTGYCGYDAFVAKFDPTRSGASSLVYSTNLGGPGDDNASAIAVDSAGNACVVGTANVSAQNSSPIFPTTPGTLQPNCPGACTGSYGWVTKLNSTATAMDYSTYLSGPGGGNSPSGVTLDSVGNAYVAGQTNINDGFPQVNALQGYPSGGNSAYVSVLDPTASTLLFSSFLGGLGNNGAAGIALDSSNNIYVTGSTTSSAFPTTANAFQMTCSKCSTGSRGVFVSEISAPVSGVPPTITSATSITFQVGVVGSFNVTTSGSPTPALSESGALPGGVTFTDNGNGTGTLSGTPTASGTFNFTFTAHNGTNPDATQNFTLTVISLQSIAVAPSSPSVMKGATQAFTATGTYSDNSSADLTASVTWSSSDTSIATIAATGVATGVKVGGPVTITAMQGSVSGTAQLTITAPSLQSIAVIPASASVAAGLTQQFTATGTYSDSSTADLTSSVAWSSSNNLVATVSNTAGSQGLAKGVSAGGPVVIAATQGAVSGSAQLTVTAATLQSITVSPASTSVPSGLTTPFTATGHYSDSSTQNLTASVTWLSSNTTVATVAASGIATGVKAGGPVTITAAQGAISGTAQLTVAAATLQSITVSPNSASVAAGLTQPFTATGHYSDSSTQNLTSSVTWSSLNTSIATNVATGVATGVKAGGPVTITATQGAISGNGSLTVTAPLLVSIAVTPANPSVIAGSAQQFAATGNYTDGTTQNITNSVTWTSSNTAVSTISASGLASALASGATNISATQGNVSGSTPMTVITLQSVTLAPQNGSVFVGLTLQYTATGHYSDGSAKDLTATATWTSSKPTIATITSPGGLATAKAKGSTTIKATAGGHSASTTLTVIAVTLVSISVTPSTATIPVRGTQQFAATATYSDGTVKDVTSTASWSSSAKIVASVNMSGLATAGSKTGTATITAKSGMASGSATLTVQ